MKIIISLTTIPPRFKYLLETIKNLRKIDKCSEIWVNIPQKYNRFPDWNGELPSGLNNSGAIINRACEDLGPGTSTFGPLDKTDATELISVDDDTVYPTNLVHSLLECYIRNDKSSAWGLSGFNFDKYFKGEYPRGDGTSVDVLEGYGACLYKIEWLFKINQDFKELLSVTWHDDMLISNLLECIGIERRTLYKTECNIQHLKQLSYGFTDDALHHVAAKDAGTSETSHTKNNIKILSDLEKIGKKYYKYHHPSISYAIMVCNESRELYSLLSFLIKVKDPNDDINILVDSSKWNTPTMDVIDEFIEHVTVNKREFDGDFASHRNYHNSLCEGDWIFVIDADEIPRESFIKNIKSILLKSNFDILYVPRINICPGYTVEWLNKVKLNVNSMGWINWPDNQGRIYKNDDKIYWDNKLHERVTGSNNIAKVEDSPENALWHIKSVERQTKQDNYYKNLV